MAKTDLKRINFMELMTKNYGDEVLCWEEDRILPTYTDMEKLILNYGYEDQGV